MASAFRIFETEIFLKDLKALPAGARGKLQRKLTDYLYPQLRTQPFFGPNIRKLKEWTPETWRYRIGPWRVFYEIDEKAGIVFLTALSLRKDAY